MSAFNQNGAPVGKPLGPGVDDKVTPLIDPLGGGDALPEATEFDGIAPPGRGVNPSTWALILVLGLAAASICAMRASQGAIDNTAANASAEERVATALAKLADPKAMSPRDPLLPHNLTSLLDVDAVVSWFAADSNRRQVPLEMIKQNPFAPPRPAHVASPQPESGGPATDRAADRRDQALSSELAQLKLQSVMGGSRPLAIVNGAFVQVGQKVGSFTVKSITGLKVELESGGRTFVLSMQAKAPAAP